jgi:hypothetical protein
MMRAVRAAVTPNQAAAVNAPIAPRIQVGHHRRRVTERPRWAHVAGKLN